MSLNMEIQEAVALRMAHDPKYIREQLDYGELIHELTRNGEIQQALADELLRKLGISVSAAKEKS
jgi:hypothetical protein